MELTCGQKRVIETEKHAVAVGQPGCGKTTAALLKAREWAASDRLKDYQQVLFLSFSRAAVRRARQEAKIQSSLSLQTHLRISTFHAFGLILLQAYWWKLGFPTHPDALQPDLERVLVKRHGYDDKDFERVERIEAKVRFSRFGPLCLQLLEKNPVLRLAISNKHPLVIVDEFQDTSDYQDQFVHCLGQDSQLLLLGDPKQRIYGFRKGLDRVDKRRMKKTAARDDFCLVKMEPTNHRSAGSGILEYARRLLNGEDLDRARRPQSVRINRCGVKAEHIYDAVWRSIGELWREYKEQVDLKARKSWSVAVMARTNALVQVLADEFERHGRRFSVLLDSDELDCSLRICLTCLEAGTRDPRELSSLVLEQLANLSILRRRRGVPKRALELEQWAAQVRAGEQSEGVAQSLMTEMRELPGLFKGRPNEDLVTVLDSLRRSVGQFATPALAIVERGQRDVSRKLLVSGLSEHYDKQGCYKGACELGESLLISEKLRESQEPRSGLTLMTMHKSKGKEYDGVVLAEGYRQDQRLTYGSREESRLLLHVAVSRARRGVRIVKQAAPAPEKKGNTKKTGKEGAEK